MASKEETREYPNEVRFNLDAKGVETLTNEIMTSVEKELSEFLKVPSKERNLKNTLLASSDLESKWSTKGNTIGLLGYVSGDKEVRDMCTDCQTKLEKLWVDISMNEDFYKAMLDFKQNIGADFDKLDEVQKRLYNKTIEDFERNGLALPEEKRKRLKEIKQRIVELATRFQKNVNEDLTKLYFTKQELEGVPEDLLGSLKEVDKEGTKKYEVSLQYPHLFPVLQYCKVAETRKQMELAHSTKCMKENVPILEEIIVLRQEESNLLGFENYAQFILALKMAKNEGNVMNFLEDLVKKLDEPAKKDLNTLLKAKEKECTERKWNFDGKLNIYDWRYYENEILTNDYKFDQEVIKQYFPLEVVTKGLMEIYQEVLNLRFNEMAAEKAHVWHPDVTQFEVFDKDSNEFMGHFYLDLHPRDGKYGHACVYPCQSRYTLSDGTLFKPAAALICNFTKPTTDKPSLLTMDEVVTYFHEFGHAMHELCSTSNYCRFSGTRVEGDFVEAPSQMLENWCYEEQPLNKMSGHYQDHSKKLPKELLENIQKTKYFLEPFKNRRQLHFGLFDMRCHTTKFGSGPVDTQQLWHKGLSEIALTPGQSGTNGSATFGHLVGGYAAGYYGYLWSKVYSSDMFGEFKRQGVLNKSMGKKYRDVILAPGGTRDSMVSLKEFLGREPSNEGFLVEIGAKQD